MKRIISALLTVLAMVAISEGCFAKTKYTYVTPQAPVITESLKPSIVKYKQGNYTGAMIDLKELLKKEKYNQYARYYLGLSYMRLGYTKEATEEFNQVIKQGGNESLSFYSQRAIMCITSPSDEICNPKFIPTAAKEAEVKKPVTAEDDDITQFIYSGKKIHPAAMDVIINERMEVKLQQDEYQRKHQEQLGPLSSAPTNEEIASALNTLSRIGINPFEQNYMLSNVPELSEINNYGSMPYAYRNSTSDIGQMLLYNQLGQQKNNFINYGI